MVVWCVDKVCFELKSGSIGLDVENAWETFKIGNGVRVNLSGIYVEKGVGQKETDHKAKKNGNGVGGEIWEGKD